MEFKWTTEIFCIRYRFLSEITSSFSLYTGIFYPTVVILEHIMEVWYEDLHIK